MALVRPYTAEHEPAVADFNRRLAAGGSGFSFRTSAPASDEKGWAAFVAVDTDKEAGTTAVRGGYVAVRHPFRVDGEDVDVHHLKLPLSEGTVDPKYNSVGVQLLVDAQRRFPLSFALGMGGRTNALPKMLESLGWKLVDVRFFFRVVRPSGFLRNASILRTTRERELALDVLAASGLGTAILPVHAWMARRAWRRGGARGSEVADFGSWVDQIWERGHGGMGFVARRDEARLRELYPTSDRRSLRLRVVDRSGDPIGWALMLDTQLRGHKQFGNMRLGSLVDGFAIPGEECRVVRCAARFLRRRGVDLMVTNQSAPGWCEAMRDNGWLERPSNYTLGLSKKLAVRTRVDAGGGALHVTRGDGDGPINL
jgi:hypothetical protein